MHMLIAWLIQKATGDWYEEQFTDRHLATFTDSLSRNPLLKRLSTRWRRIGRHIKTLKDLVLCYYSGIKICCIPHHKISPGPFLIEKYQGLYDEIQRATEITRQIRQVNGLLWDWHDLDMYLGYAFNHFCQDYSKPFNFLTAALGHNPVHSSFHLHIIEAALRLKACREAAPTHTKVSLFVALAPLIASSILMDVCRKKLPQKRK